MAVAPTSQHDMHFQQPYLRKSPLRYRFRSAWVWRCEAIRLFNLEIVLRLRTVHHIQV